MRRRFRAICGPLLYEAGPVNYDVFDCPKKKEGHAKKLKAPSLLAGNNGASDNTTLTLRERKGASLDSLHHSAKCSVDSNNYRSHNAQSSSAGFVISIAP